MVQTFPWLVTDDELVLNCLTTRGQKRCSDSRSITSGPPLKLGHCSTQPALRICADTVAKAENRMRQKISRNRS